MRIYGIAAAQNTDNSGETILIDKMDTSRFRVLCDEHGEDAWSIIGGIDYFKKIYRPEECEDEQQKRCWEIAQVPFLFVKGEIAEDSGHPNAQAAASLVRFTAKRPDLPLKVGLSIEGGIAERTGPDEKTLSKTIATGAAFTVKPCNPRCRLFMENDLQKSETINTPPAVYYEALKKSQATRSIVENPQLMLMLHLEDLKKSLGDYFESFTSMKCYTCGEGIRFFKASKHIPNRCPHCDESFSLSDIWNAINKQGV